MSLSQHAAPGGAAAFSYQFERALLWLAQSPAGARIGIETNDDVSVVYSDGSQLLEQDKHTIRQAHPFSNRSKDLWNTLAIWVDAIVAGEVAEHTAFRMVTNAELPDCIAKSIGDAQSHEDIHACIESLTAAANEPHAGIAALVNRVLDTSREDALLRVIQNTELLDASKSTSGPALRQLTISHLQLPASAVPQADSVVDELLGWLHKEVLLSWQAGQPGWIQRDNFVNCLHSILERRKRQKTRERAELLVPVSDVELGEKKASRFVRQLHLITDDSTIVDNAIREFVRSRIEKIRLSTEGEVTDSDWIAFEQSLMSRWQIISKRVVRLTNRTDIRDIGYEVFYETTEDYREKLAGADTEHVYLTSGAYHALAEDLSVGWHPQYESLIKLPQE